MDKRKQNQSDIWEYSAYDTGSTEPPRNNSTLVTVLLILVICLIGAVSALGWQNIQLFQQLHRQSQEDTTPLSILEEGEFQSLDTMPELSVAAVPQDDDGLGISAEEVSPFYQRYYQLPKGLYITQVIEDSIAEKLGLQPGDVLLSINGKSITTTASLKSLLISFTLGETVEIRIYRAGQEHSFQLTLGYSGHSDR